EEFVSYAEEHEMKSFVTFHEGVPFYELPAVLADADIGMVPTKDSVFSDEAVSMKSLEYIFMGIPVVISKTKGHSYYYGDSMVKFFEPCNSGDLARAVIDLFRNRASREEQVRNSRRFIEENSWARVKKVYVEIAGSRSGESIS